MDRRHFLFAGLCLAALGGSSALAPVAAQPVVKPFKPTRFSVFVQGSGPDVILIPGLAASRSVWTGTAAALPGYRYHILQISGFAGTPAGGNAQGDVAAPVAAEIARYIAANGLKRPALVGHSMGGTIAMMVAARRPALVGKLMVVDMLPQPAGLLGSSSEGVRSLAGALRDLSGTPGGRRLVESVIGMFGQQGSDARRSDPDVVARATHELAVLDLTPELAKIQAPMTIVYAAQDETRHAAVDRAYASGYSRKKGARLIRVDKSSHMIMYDQPARFRAVLKDFLAS